MPCLWWRGISQDAAQLVAWHLATVWLVGVSVLQPPRRTVWEPLAGWLLVAALASGVMHLRQAGQIPLLAVYALMTWLGLWVLVSYAPSAEWVTRRVRWLVWGNLAYAGLQALGYDVLFETPDLTGLFSRRNLLGVLLLIGLPLVAGWRKGPLVAGMALCGSLTALVGAGGLGTWWLVGRYRRSRQVIVAATAGVCGVAAWWCWPEVLSRVLPRLIVWDAVVREAIWPPALFIGYGLNAWEANATWQIGPWFYSAYLAAWHIGGLVLLGALGAAVRWVWRQPACPERTALLLLAWAGLVQTPWHFTRIVIVTTALVAAMLIRRDDAD